MTNPLTPIHRANEAESWEWLTANAPTHAEAVEQAIENGAGPDDIYRAIIRDTNRPEFARRCLLAARYIHRTTAGG